MNARSDPAEMKLGDKGLVPTEAVVASRFPKHYLLWRMGRLERSSHSVKIEQMVYC
ncbi:MAG: hypothetical protein FD146_1401 [Anaerolineaceae bacterium]|nr:MAG: hypothetical protein FD146_1401 [Anaerolineaceae bacterium]